MGRSVRVGPRLASGLLEEAAGGVVREDLAAGLAGWAVAHRVARVLDLPHGVPADRAGLAGALVDPAGAVGRRAHVVPAPLEGQALVDGFVDGRHDARRVVEPELGGPREGRELGSVADLVGQAAADAGDAALVAQERVQAHAVL